MQLFATVPAHLSPIVGGILAAVGIAGLIALLSPRWFAWLAHIHGRWIDTDEALSQLDRRIDIDWYVLPYARQLGAAVLASTVIIGWFLARS